MVDITVEILATSVPIPRDKLKYKIKTWWTSVDVEDSASSIRLSTLPLIQHFYDLNARETTIFIEMWYQNEGMFPKGKMRFLGLAKQRVDNQLRNPAWNPTLEWLEVYDPIEDILRGRLLLKVDAQFSDAGNVPPNKIDPQANEDKLSSYFHHYRLSLPQPDARLNKEDDNKTPDPDPVGTAENLVTPTEPLVAVPSAEPEKLNEEVRTDDLVLTVHAPAPRKDEVVLPKVDYRTATATNMDLEFKKHQSEIISRKFLEDKESVDIDFELAKARMELQLKEAGMLVSMSNMKNLHQEELEIGAEPDEIFGDLSPIRTTTQSRRNTNKVLSETVLTNLDSDMEDIILLLNDKRLEEAGTRTPLRGSDRASPRHSTKKTDYYPPKMPSKGKPESQQADIDKKVQELERMQEELKKLRFTVDEHNHNPLLTTMPKSSPPKRDAQGREHRDKFLVIPSHKPPIPNTNRTRSCSLTESSDVTLYCCHVEIRPTFTSSEQITQEWNKDESESTSKSKMARQPPVISHKCAAVFGLHKD